MERQIEEGALKKLILPSSEAAELRRLLFAEGVSRAHLMPTLDNVRHTLHSHLGRSRLCRVKFVQRWFRGLGEYALDIHMA